MRIKYEWLPFRLLGTIEKQVSKSELEQYKAWEKEGKLKIIEIGE